MSEWVDKGGCPFHRLAVPAGWSILPGLLHLLSKLGKYPFKPARVVYKRGSRGGCLPWHASCGLDRGSHTEIARDQALICEAAVAMRTHQFNLSQR